MLGWESYFRDGFLMGRKEVNSLSSLYDPCLGLGVRSEGTLSAASVLVEDSALACFSMLKACGRPAPVH